jgi:hypothetical protein
MSTRIGDIASMEYGRRMGSEERQPRASGPTQNRLVQLVCETVRRG